MGNQMFCYQCEQTAKCEACTGSKGVCGKTDVVANGQDVLTGSLVALAQAGQMVAPDEAAIKTMVDGMFACVTNVNFDEDAVNSLIEDVQATTARLAKSAASDTPDPLDMTLVWEAPVDIRSLKSLILFGLRGMSAYAHHAMVLGYADEKVNGMFFKGMAALARENDADALTALVLEVGEANLACMALLDKANTETYGNPEPTTASMTIEPGPFVVISGHDLHDMELLLDQAEKRGVAVYTHSEMLPGLAYPKLKAHANLKGNFGTAWQNQQKEFADVPGAFLFTTNCIMPPRESYADRVFTTGPVAYPGCIHIGEDKDFTPVLDKAIELGGYAEPHEMHGINGGSKITTGFGRNAVLSVAPAVIDAVKGGAIRHFFLVGGCDGAKPARSYYTDFVKATPSDTVVLTLACGKYRFNDLELGEIGGIPRLLDVGQCNDAYGAIQIALALADAFGCGVNDLPLSMVLSWYEQKAVAILLTLLYLGIQDIYLGPTLPAFVSPDVLSFLIEKFGIRPTGSAEEDLAVILSA